MSFIENKSFIDEKFGDLLKRTVHNGSMTSHRRSDALPPPPREVLSNVLNHSEMVIEWLAGDGSDRCYYRIRLADEANSTFVLMQLSKSDAEQLEQGEYDWLRVASLFESHGIRHPKAVHVLYEYAAIIIEDYGDQMLETFVMNHLDAKQEIENYYDQAFSMIMDMLVVQDDPENVWKSRSFDKEKYHWELSFFANRFVDLCTDYTWTKESRAQFEAEIKDLSNYLAPYSSHCVHRDFHARNLMVKDKSLAVIDFQDARLGPMTYDLVSLVYDNYTPFSAEFRLKLLEKGQTVLGQLPTFQTHQETLPAVILQRQLKAIGTYGYLTEVKKRGNYLVYVAPAQESIKQWSASLTRWPLLSTVLADLKVKESTSNTAGL